MTKKKPESFTENKGQWAEEVNCFSQAEGK